MPVRGEKEKRRKGEGGKRRKGEEEIGEENYKLQIKNEEVRV